MPGLNNVATLNEFLADKSYIVGYQPSQADAVVFEAHASAPSAEHVHAARWYKHIASFGDKRKNFAGERQALSAYGPADAEEEEAPAAEEKKADDDEFDLFGGDEEEDEEAEKLKAQRVAEYQAKKSAKPAIIAKSSILLDVKPWDDTTDMAALEAGVRAIEADGLVWGASKLLPVAFGVKKLQIMCTVEDDKVGTDFLEETITALEDYVQSVDVAAFNKI